MEGNKFEDGVGVGALSTPLLVYLTVKKFFNNLLIASSEGNPTHTVETTSGPVIGQTIQLATGKWVDRFLVIRYAQANRFEKSTQPTPWTDPFEAFSYGKNCPQSQSDNIDEDCLFINVFVPHRRLDSDEQFHVMHWIHGGAYVTGSGDYDGSAILATEGDVIVVTCNYRLGVLGYLAKGDSDLPGNYGMFDQQFALQWTQDNIEK